MALMFRWSNTSNGYFRKSAEWLVCSRFLEHDLDVYLPLLDNGVDLAVRRPRSRNIYDIQVKAARSFGPNGPITFTKTFVPSDCLFVVFALYGDESEPALYLLPSRSWEEGPHKMFKSPTAHTWYEFDFNLSYEEVLQKYQFNQAITRYIV
jgi:hypothetical protein